ncbi:MAG: hypothetical protein WBQ44_13035 [Rhodococcus sp. (in: high G+C Gram-positive bacteria)]
MRDKVIALSSVGVAGIAVAVGLTIGALGGAFDDSDQRVPPPALRSDLSTAVSASSSAITVPPSPTWQVAVPTTPKPTTTVPTTTQATSAPAETTSRSSRRTTTSTTEESEEATSTRSR